ncbi:MAG TPA: hypothetical protein VNF68_07910 [Candidatus Baltobacteraceae bacterium]|nr:hypothetical protein [Candidatus Baltobacteraceae bacterium]
MNFFRRDKRQAPSRASSRSDNRQAIRLDDRPVRCEDCGVMNPAYAVKIMSNRPLCDNCYTSNLLI